MDSSTLLTILDDYQRYRINYEPRWDLSRHAYENEHFVGWSRSQGTLVKLPFRKKLFHQLPEVTKQTDAMENLLLTVNPLFHAYPNDFSSDEDIKRARYYSMLLKDYYYKWFMENLLHQYVHNGLVYPLSYFQVAVEYEYDSEKDQMVKDVTGHILDAFDVLFNPRIAFE